MTFVGIDVGTFESKGVLVDPSGTVLALARRRHGISTPGAGHVEHDPDADWWAGVCEISRELMAHPRGRQVQAIGVSAIGPCVVALDAELRPLRPAILYGVDTRASTQITDLTGQLGGAEIFRRSGNALTSQSAGPKIAWLQEQEPDIWARARWFTTSQSYLVARLTGEVVIDHATAGYFHPLYDLSSRRWDVTGCEHFAPLEKLPPIAWSCEIAGRVHAAAAAETGLPQGTAVIVGTTDAPAEAVGAGVLGDGDVMAMYGSTGYFDRVGTTPITSEQLWAAPFVFEGTYVLAAGTATAGTATRWVSDLLGITADSDEVTFARLLELAHGSPPGARGVLALPHFAGERTPFQDPNSRAVIAGLGLDHGPADVARAVLEGVGHSLAAALGAYAREGIALNRVVAVGGATMNDIIMSTVSTITGLTQQVAPSPGAAFGDAFLAAVGVGALVPVGVGALAPVSVSAPAHEWFAAGRLVTPNESARQRLTADHSAYLSLYRALASWNLSRT
jgi:xylulokinase